MTLEVRRLDARGRARFHDRIVALEADVSYPLGADRFTLDHGDDYFAFFDRLGAAATWVALDGERVVGVASGVLRATPAPAWYGCDLKVHAGYRGRGVHAALFAAGVAEGRARCGRFYGISMDPPGRRRNPVARLLRRLPGPAVTPAARLRFFTCDHGAMRAAAPVLARARGRLRYRSLRGVKDVVLQSTGAPMPLLHVQWGEGRESGRAAPQPGHLHMFCVPEGDPLLASLRQRGLEPHASATIVQHGIKRAPWTHILTSDI